MSSLSLRKFEMEKIKFSATEAKGPTVVLLGKRDTGKSFLIKDLLYYHQDIPIGTVISGTEEGNGFYGSLVPRTCIHHSYNASIIENVLRRQKDVLKRSKKMAETYGHSTTDDRVFVIMDDLLYDTSWTKDKVMKCMFMNGRHWKIMLIITMQYPLGIGPALRTNIDYVFILRENYISNRRRIYDNYAGMFPSFEAFCQTMDQCTENYTCLVIDNNSKSNKLNEQVFWYRAVEHEPFRLGSDKYWQLSENMNSDDEDEIDTARMRKRNQISINVKKIG